MRLVPLPLLLLALQLACECPAQSPAVAPRDVQSHAAASVPLRFSACDDEEFDSVVDLVEHELYAHAGGQVRPNGSLEGRAHGFAARSGGRANKTLVELLAEKLGPDPGQNPDPEGARPKRPALAVGITSNAVAFHMQRERGGRYTARDASASFEEAAAQDVKATVGEVGLAADARCTSGRSRRVRGKGGWSLHHTGLPSAGSEDDSRCVETPLLALACSSRFGFGVCLLSSPHSTPTILGMKKCHFPWRCSRTTSTFPPPLLAFSLPRLRRSGGAPSVSAWRRRAHLMKLGRPIATRVLSMQWVGGDRRLRC